MPRGKGEEQDPPLTGRLLADRYRLDAPLEAGGAGEVWSARDTVLNRPVAVQLIDQEHAADEAFVSRFRAGSRHAAALSHSGVAQVFDYGEREGTSPPCPYLVMERVSGQPLAELLEERGALPADVVLDITAQAARALQAAHDIGITHGHVQPANLLVTDEGLVKLTEFGIAGVTPEPDARAVPGAGPAGAAAYLSPEQAGGSPATPASDIYSLGVVAYECVAGRLPFPGKTSPALAAAPSEEPAAGPAGGEPRPLPDDVPAPVRNLIMRMVAADPWLRPGSALAVAETARALRNDLLSARPLAAEPPGPLAGTPTAGPLAAGPAGPLAVHTAGPVTAGTGPDLASTTAPQPAVSGLRPRTSRGRRRRILALAAVAAGVTAVSGALAAMMIGGKPPTAPRHALHSPGPGGVQAMVPAMPTARPRHPLSQRPRIAASRRSSSARPAARASGPAAPRRASTTPTARNTSPAPTPRPSTSPSPPSVSPAPTPSLSPSASASRTWPGSAAG